MRIRIRTQTTAMERVLVLVSDATNKTRQKVLKIIKSLNHLRLIQIRMSARLRTKTEKTLGCRLFQE